MSDSLIAGIREKARENVIEIRKAPRHSANAIPKREVGTCDNTKNNAETEVVSVFGERIQIKNDESRYGAWPMDWNHLAIVAGLKKDLLPVVCNPNAVISPRSKMKKIGKTPSIYNPDRQVAGINGWSERETTEQEIVKWAKKSDYGIGIQSRTIRALDVDVPDPALATEIRQFIADHLEACGVEMCVRMRENSSKFLVAFQVEGSGILPKRFIHTRGGVIEFLGDGQQFVAVGCHDSGASYAWEGGLPAEFPRIGLDDFETLFDGLEKTFGIKKATRLNETKRPTEARTRPANPDPISDHLYQHGYVYSESPDGARLNIRCPFEHEHTSESSESATQYFLADTGGFSRGHFKCLHAHCAERSDGDFLAEIGYEMSMFGDVTVAQNLQKDTKGKFLSSVGNVVCALSSPAFSGVEIGRDFFRDEIMIRPYGDTGWRSFRDEDYTKIRILLENNKGFRPVSRDCVRDSVALVANDYSFDSARVWLESLPVWDGVHRIETFLPRYFGTKDSDYTRAVSRYLWTALAGRVLSPGCKADMVPILVGRQGAGKSRGVTAISPSPDFFVELSFHEKDDDLARRMRGRLVAELGELRGLRTKELEWIKAFITRTHEVWTPKYQEMATQYPRRMVFIGTTNQDDFLADDTGNRRWLPVRVGSVDVAAIEMDRNQLWAEGRELFIANENTVCYSDAERLAPSVHDDHKVTDAWFDVIAEWLDSVDPLTESKPSVRDYLTVLDVAREALRIEERLLDRNGAMRIGSVLKQLGYERVRVMVNGRRFYRYERK